MKLLTESLLHRQNECCLCWVKKDGSPASTIVSFVYMNEKIWMTALAGTGRVKAIERNPQVSVTISGKGCEVGHSRCVSIQGACEILSDQISRDYFFPAFANAVLANSAQGAAMMASMMNTENNLVLVLTPNKIIPYDAHDMLSRADGQ